MTYINRKYFSVVAVRNNTSNNLPEGFEYLEAFVGLCVEFIHVTSLRKFRN